jgi:uncharacterized protein YrrD
VTRSERPIAWPALQKGTPIFTSDGEEIGKVSRVIADEQKDIFSGLTFRSGLLDAARFVPADLVSELTDGAVHLAIASDDVGRLSSYEG